ncbi:hypothetical protein, partial [Fulvimarina sp. MAC3]|uniref:hypothetical protein n=1 Tax=Fulvimarina sp. MAC3 TaxID=3148887 RepID=UPI0031FD13CC
TLGDLCDCIALELISEIDRPHPDLLASKSGKKASTNLGAIHTRCLAAATPTPPSSFRVCCVSMGGSSRSMNITWTDASGIQYTAPVPEVVAPFVEAIGLEKTARLVTSFGGTRVFFPVNTTNEKRCEVSSLLEREATLTIGRTLGPGEIDIPLANVFLARHLKSTGLPHAKIARKLRVSEVTVRNLLRPDEARQSRSRKIEDTFERNPNRRVGVGSYPAITKESS